MFDYDWFHKGGLQRLIDEARNRCTARKFPDEAGKPEPSPEFVEFRDALETRIILYMKDGLTYEVKQITDLGTSSALAFECVPVDENYRVGSIVIMAPFDDIARVEVFAVHPDDKPQDNFKIPGFRGGTESGREAG